MLSYSTSSDFRTSLYTKARSNSLYEACQAKVSSDSIQFSPVVNVSLSVPWGMCAKWAEVCARTKNLRRVWSVPASNKRTTASSSVPFSTVSLP